MLRLLAAYLLAGRASAQPGCSPTAGCSPCGTKPCLPNWKPDYNVCSRAPTLQAGSLLPALTGSDAAQMSRSTIFMPCNYSGPYDPAIAAKFGIVDFDVRQPPPPPNLHPTPPHLGFLHDRRRRSFTSGATRRTCG